MAYCAWADVVKVFPLASTIEAVGASQTILIAEGSAMADTYLSPIMRTPVQLEDDGAYPQAVISFTAYLVADSVAQRRFDGADDQWESEYDGNKYTGTRHGHKAMCLLQALRQAKAATEDQTTEPDLSVPLVETSFTTTNGIVEARFLARRFMREVPTLYTFTIESASGDVAGGDLTVSCQRDYDDSIWASATPVTIADTGWVSVEYGLQVRFRDAASSAAWTTAETFQITCEPYTAIARHDGVKAVEVMYG